MTNVSYSKSELRTAFFTLLFGDTKGWICLATTNRDQPKLTFKQQFYLWPDDFRKIEEYILKHEPLFNIYFCINLLSKPDRKKQNCLPTQLLWADLDAVNPDKSPIPIPILLNTSGGRWQAIWRMSVAVDAFQAEEYSRRLAYALSADKSGWDLTQLLRVPLTNNFKYNPPHQVGIESLLEATAPPLLFEALAVGNPSEQAIVSMPIPHEAQLTSAEHVIYKYNAEIKRSAFFALYTQTPTEDADWSSILWRFIHECLKCGMDADETFACARVAKCNKYARDGRPIEHLWREVLKAAQEYDKLDANTVRALVDFPELVEGKPGSSFVDVYRAWAVESTDAVPDFHDMSLFIILSAIVSSSVRLDTSAGPLTPNLWGMILGDSTLTRKTTAMRLAVDLLLQLDPAMIVATDGTSEGLLSALESRPNRASIFYKDEISGMFDSMNRKDYLAGMQETLTALYDVPPIYTRRLRKETLVIESPSFVFLGGGVTERVHASVNDDYILSGFLPRFLVVSGEAEVENRRPLGRATAQGIEERKSIQSTIADFYQFYTADVTMHIAGQQMRVPPRITADLTDEAWATNSKFEKDMLSCAHDSVIQDLALPTFNRMSRSLLKMAVILGAIRQEPVNNKIQIENDDVLQAAWYIQSWAPNTIALMGNAGKGQYEKLIERVVQWLVEHPGATRSQIMNRFRLNAKDMQGLHQTLEERTYVRTEKQGRGHAYWAV